MPVIRRKASAAVVIVTVFCLAVVGALGGCRGTKPAPPLPGGSSSGGRAGTAVVTDAASLARLFSTADEVRVVESDVSAEARTLDPAGRARLSDVASSLQPYRQDPNANPLPTPYPDYRLEIATGTTVVRVFLSRDHVVAMWQTDAFGQAEFSDREGKLWALLKGLAPAPDPAGLEGPRRLFSYGKARAGFNTPVEVGAGWVPVVVRCLLTGTPGAGGPPVGDNPIELGFSDSLAGAAASCVLLYEDGFVLDGRFYEAPGVLQTVGTNMVNAGSW